MARMALEVYRNFGNVRAIQLFNQLLDAVYVSLPKFTPPVMLCAAKCPKAHYQLTSMRSYFSVVVNILEAYRNVDFPLVLLHHVLPAAS